MNEKKIAEALGTIQALKLLIRNGEVEVIMQLLEEVGEKLNDAIYGPETKPVGISYE